ncbi:uncharacterized protein LOC135698552 [Ochlerotatus camptorhynchus]|uniref:uncharacterized protein LOC135698552 n=1 Tax=Ochlerotatus camptorhynchus TaxID=644619 RepID=UPI0031DF3A0E
MDQHKNYFDVVQTKEAGKLVLTAVPHRWVCNGFLMWPEKNANKLRKDLKSEPTSGWSKIACSVKRKYIPSYEEAEMEAAELSGQNTESSDSAPRKKKQKKTTKDGLSRRFDFNHLVAGNGNLNTGTEHTGPQSNVTSVVDDSQNHPVLARNLLCSPSVNQVDDIFSTQQPDQSVYLTTGTEAGQRATDEMQAIMTEGEYVYYQQPVVDADYIVNAVSEKIELECSKIQQAMLSAIGSMMAAFKSDIDVKLAAALRAKTNPSDENDEKFTFSPMSSTEQINELEKNLADETYSKRFISYMKKVIGYVGDNCNGLNISYTLVDHFFERNVMMKCSWSGASRSTTIKLAIKNCTNILDTFFAIVHSVNTTFSKQLLEHFFKQVARNSKKRSEAKGLRQPSIHRRAKRSNNKLVKAADASTRNSNKTRKEWISTSDDDSQSSKSSSSDDTDNEMLVSKVEECELHINST